MAASSSPTPVIDPLAYFKVQVSYASDNTTATMLVAEILADAGGGQIAVDFETAPVVSERKRSRQLQTELAAAMGRKQALAKVRDNEKLRLAKAEVAALEKAVEYADRAGLDPHRAYVRLVQIYAGGKRVAVLDMDEGKVCWSVLDPIWERPIVVHNALFELSFLEKRGIEPVEVQDTMQAVRLLRGRDATSLESAVATYFDLQLDKSLQTSDWSLPNLSLAQIRYAAVDALVGWHLCQTIFPLLGERMPAYQIQVEVIPAVVRMQLRGVLMDLDAHAALVAALQQRRAELVIAYAQECERINRDDLRFSGVPNHAPAVEALLNRLLTEQERANWPRTERSGRLSAKRADLVSGADAYPLLKILVEIGRIEKQLNTYGPGLAAQVSPITGRIHASYKVAGAVSGRSTCKHPNMQNIPDEQKIEGLPSFRTLFVAKPGHVLVVGDWASMEMRAGAYISGDTAMTQAFIDGSDLHVLTARTMLGLSAEEWAALPEEVQKLHRKHAKPVNFGRMYGQGAASLVEAARSSYGVILDLNTAREWIRAFEETYPDYTRWCRDFAEECRRTGEIPIGREGGRVHEIHLNPDGYRYTQCLNLPIQGGCADPFMRALTAIDRRLFEEGIEGGPVVAPHDEFGLEVPEKDADRAAVILREEMIRAFAETFPGAPLNNLVAIKIGRNWAETK